MTATQCIMPPYTEATVSSAAIRSHNYLTKIFSLRLGVSCPLAQAGYFYYLECTQHNPPTASIPPTPFERSAQQDSLRTISHTHATLLHGFSLYPVFFLVRPQRIRTQDMDTERVHYYSPTLLSHTPFPMLPSHTP